MYWGYSIAAVVQCAPCPSTLRDTESLKKTREAYGTIDDSNQELDPYQALRNSRSEPVGPVGRSCLLP